MSPEEKRRLLISELVARGEKERRLAPWVFRVLWRAGINVPPPLYCTLRWHLMTVGLFAAVFWGTTMWIFAWRDSPLWIVCGAAICFGSTMAWWNWVLLGRRRRSLGLCERWEHYPTPENNEVEQATAQNPVKR